MLYNEPGILYGTPGLSYVGTLILNVTGTISPIIIEEATIIFDLKEDYSNATTIGLISIDTDPYGIMTFSTTDSQANAILQAETIIVYPDSEVAVIYGSNSSATAGAIISLESPSAEISIA